MRGRKREIRPQFENIIEESGYEIVGIAQNDPELNEKCHVLQPDLVIADINVLGLDAIDRWENQDRLDHLVPMIVLCDRHHEESVPLSDICFVKPVAAPQLTSAIRTLLRGHRNRIREWKKISEPCRWFG